MRAELSLVVAATGMVLATTPIWAHHSFAAEYDEKKVVQLRGTVTKMEWVNPHAMLHINVIGADGSVKEWMIEGNTPNSLLRAGLTRKLLEPGAQIAVRGYLAKSGENKASGISVALADGRTLSLGSPYDDASGVSSVDNKTDGVSIPFKPEEPAQAPAKP